jgi:hypothetical protein
MTSTIQTTNPILGDEEISSWVDNPLFHVTRICLAFLQGLFSYADKGFLRWTSDPEETDIIITDSAPIEAESVNKRPAIVSVRGPVRWAGIALDQLAHYDFKTGERTHTDLLSGFMTFNCLSRKKVPAELMAWVTGRHCWILRRMMLRQGFHDFGQKIEIGSPSPPGGIIQGTTDPEIINVPVMVPYHFQYQDTIGERDLAVATEFEMQLSTISPEPVAPTPVAEGGSPGPGLRGSGTGAVVLGLKGLRPPSISGRVVTEYTTDVLPDSQNSTPIIIRVIT